VMNATKRAIMVKQPVGTNHFQFLVHQLSFDCGGIGGGTCSINLFYFKRREFYNLSYS